ncbi:MAG: amidohydrolase family protein [Clostridiales Family XIII bacterium]|nr:amidohydrolase family protein [Clostridia bacterium]MDY3010272.1 amidohydrolase family protein [Clostridiales Family XIII bacterium]
MKRIIDFHTHLGDCFDRNKDIVFKKPVILEPYTDPLSELAKSGFREPIDTSSLQAKDQLADAMQNRVLEKGSLEKASEEMDKNNITYFVSLNNYPNTSFDETRAASKMEYRIIPFTSADFGTEPWDIRDVMERDIANGAKGLYIHPQLQGIKVVNGRARAAIEAFDKAGLPVVLHFGEDDCYYRQGSESAKKAPGEYGALSWTAEIISKYPNCRFVLTHSALTTDEDLDVLMDCAKKNGWENVYVVTSYKCAETIKKLAGCFGADHVLFGSDFPFCDVSYALKECEKAFAEDDEALEKVLYQNAVALTRLYE